MKFSEQLKGDHESGDFGLALDGYSDKAEALEDRVKELEAELAEVEVQAEILNGLLDEIAAGIKPAHG